jgi:RNA 2',3'-cyclic 3'-phosphodiesterase
MYMRTFIAIELLAQIKQHLNDITQLLRRSEIHAGWVKPDNLHLTLKFLGDIDDTLLPQLAEQIDLLARQHTTFRANLDGLGFFPSPRRPRILYAAVKEPLPFNQLAQHLDQRLQPLGFAAEKRFHPHITLARFKSIKNLEILQQMADDIPLRHSFTVNTISLVGSTLRSDGAHYQMLQHSLLREADA